MKEFIRTNWPIVIGGLVSVVLTAVAGVLWGGWPAALVLLAWAVTVTSYEYQDYREWKELERYLSGLDE